MNQSAAKPLYTREILQAAMSLADHPFDDTLPYKAELRSQTCGSRVMISLAVDSAGDITKFGIKAEACALGQASAAILARHITGNNSADVESALHSLSGFLHEDSGQIGNWPDLNMLRPAKDYPARRDSVLLPWRATLIALKNQGN